MEQFLSFFITNDSLVISILVAVIAVTILLLMIMSFRSSESGILNEAGSTESSQRDVEGALRRVLGEQSWMSRSQAADSGEPVDDSAVKEQVERLEEENLSKDKQIAELNKQLTQGAGLEGGATSASDDADLQAQIKSLEDRLKEYEIIEDDIADLSLYKSENQKLKDEIESLRSSGGGEEVAEPVQPEDGENVSVIEAVEAGEAQTIDEGSDDESPQEGWEISEDSEAPSGKDLVAEFEKVVNNQDNEVKGEEFGSIDKVTDKANERMENIEPDSKEEAEVLIEDLKLLKKEK